MSTNTQMYDALTIADAMLKIGKRKGQTMTPMKLLKLVYIAHGFSLALLNRDLFQNRIEAWKFGPVIPDLYQATKRFGREEIPLNLIGDPEDTSVDPEVQSFLEDVYEKYGHLNGIQLSYLTHQSGTPWDQVYDPRFRNEPIPDDLIADHYRGMLVA
ncbi:Panacea domain-containing protein [Sulfitobacter dubius]|uniref:Antitoxin SocA n=1 Tax=Sulfitobacter dubius TaxID=218673 RepID=A0ABY3ZIK0_9RHOB|nr:type II toxin-antitoxin system antitoxin SocA domain-containing protein [Sulfitobacter dubius]UOA14492.1 Antitoxin SocA [Sulfitobacter dubius]